MYNSLHSSWHCVATITLLCLCLGVLSFRFERFVWVCFSVWRALGCHVSGRFSWVSLEVLMKTRSGYLYVLRAALRCSSSSSSSWVRGGASSTLCCQGLFQWPYSAVLEGPTVFRFIFSGKLDIFFSRVVVCWESFLTPALSAYLNQQLGMVPVKDERLCFQLIPCFLALKNV